jgi:hypothetical protein
MNARGSEARRALPQMRVHEFSRQLDDRVHVADSDFLLADMRCRGVQSCGGSRTFRLQLREHVAFWQFCNEGVPGCPSRGQSERGRDAFIDVQWPGQGARGKPGRLATDTDLDP